MKQSQVGSSSRGGEIGLVQSTILEAFGRIGEPPSAITDTLTSEELGWETRRSPCI